MATSQGPASTLTPDFVSEVFAHLWMNQIKHDYLSSRLNNEAALQASVVRGLSPFFPRMQVIVTPRVNLGEASNRIPDLFVCERPDASSRRDGRVLAAIELKFVLKSYPIWERDLKKLVRVASNATIECDDLNPVTCNKGVHYLATTETIGIFAAIANYKADALNTTTLDQRLRKKKYWSGVPSCVRILHCYGAINPEQCNNEAPKFGANWLLHPKSRKARRSIL